MGTEKGNSAAVVTVPPAEVKELGKRLENYLFMLRNKKSVLRHVFGTRKHEFLNSWAEDLELSINYGIAPQGLDRRNQISAFIRRNLIDAGLEQAVPYAREVLPAKFKQHDMDENSEEILPRNSSLNTPVTCPKCNQPFDPAPRDRDIGRALCPNCRMLVHFGTQSPAHENEVYINLLEQFIDTLRTVVIPKLRKEHFASKLDPADYQQSMVMGYAWLQLLNEVFDDRQGIATNTQHLLLACAIAYGVNEADTFYFADVKEKFELTRKQTRKIITGIIRGLTKNNGEFDFTKIKDIKGKLHVMFEPKDADEARLNGFSGHACPECGCWRTNRRYHSTDRAMLHCWGCGHWWDYKSDSLYKDPNAKELDYEQGKDGKPVLVARPAAGNRSA